MTVAEWVGIVAALFAIVGGFVASIGWLVKHYLSELRPNSGSSLNDRVTRMETMMYEMYRLLIEKQHNATQHQD